MASKEQVRKWQGHLALQEEKNLPTSLALNLYFAMPSIPSMADVLQLELSLRTVLPRTSREGPNGVKLMLGEEGYLFTRLSDDKCLCPVALFNKLISAQPDKKEEKSKGSQGGGIVPGKPLLHGLTLSTLCDSLSEAIASTTPELGPLKEEQELLHLLEVTRPNLAPPQPEEASPDDSAAGSADEAVGGGGESGGDNKKACRVCGQPGVLKCAGCGKARYCSRACQKSDWTTHKKECKAKVKAKHNGEHSPLAT